MQIMSLIGKSKFVFRIDIPMKIVINYITKLKMYAVVKSNAINKRGIKMMIYTRAAS